MNSNKFYIKQIHTWFGGGGGGGGGDGCSSGHSGYVCIHRKKNTLSHNKNKLLLNKVYDMLISVYSSGSEISIKHLRF